MNSYKIQEFKKYTSYKIHKLKIHKLKNTRVIKYTSVTKIIHELRNTEVKKYTREKIVIKDKSL